MKKGLFVILIGSVLVLGSAFDQPAKIKEPIEQVLQFENLEKDNSKSYVQNEFEALTADLRKEDGKSISEMIGEVLVDTVQVVAKAVLSFFGRLFS